MTLETNAAARQDVVAHHKCPRFASRLARIVPGHTFTHTHSNRVSSVPAATDLSEVLDDDGDAACSALSAVASLAAIWPQLFQGCSLKQLDLDSCTLSEILRLHILASGADCYHGNAKFRYQKQGGFTLMDDPCVELRLAEAGLLKRLSTTAVYDLTPG